MSEIANILLVLIVVLGIIAVVGHGIWVGTIWFLRMIFGVVPGEARRAPCCPRCKRGEVVEGKCWSCGLVLFQNEPTPPPPVDERTVVVRHLRRLHESGTIDAATLATVIEAMAAVELSEDAAHREPLETADARRNEVVSPLAAEPVPAERLEETRPASGAAELEEWGVPPIPAEPVVIPPPPPVQPRPARPVKPPRKPMSELFAAFMEESNIRWGELVGGLLIVGCSIALVFTFWDWIAVRPWFKFFLFTAITGSVFATGLYTEHRWRLPNTSRGLLLIATLLVPLNFLAIAAFSRDVGTLAVARIAGELLATGLFAWLVYSAGKIITPGWSLALVGGVLGASFSQVVVHRFAPSASPVGIVALACLPLFFYLGSVAAALRAAWKWETIGRAQTTRLFTFVGAVSFAAVMPLGLLAFSVPDFRATLERVAPVVGLYGLPALAAGLFLWKRLENDKQLVASRTAGTSITVFGAVVLVGSMVLAWPNPASLLCASLLNFAILSGAAMVFGIPAGHLLAMPCAVLGYLLAFHLSAGHVVEPITTRHLLAVLLSATSGVALVPVVAVIAMAAEYLRRRSRTDHARCYLLVGAATAAASLALVSWHGFGRTVDHGATWVYGIYTLAAFAAAWRLKRVEAVWVASILLAATLAQAMVFGFPVADGLIDRWTIAILTHASLMTGLMLLARLRTRIKGAFTEPLADVAFFSSVVSAALIIFAAFTSDTVAGHALPLAAATCWLAAIWLTLSTVNVSPALFTAFQAALIVAVAFAATHVLQQREWFANAAHPFADPWTWQAYGVALGTLSLLWIAIRLFASKRIRGAPKDATIESDVLDRTDRASRLLWPAWPTVDRCVTWLLYSTLLVMSAYAIWPGITTELSNRLTPVTFTPQSLTFHQHARDWGAWLMLAVTATALLATLREAASAPHLLAAVTTLACACLLFAARWQDVNAAASALRWTLGAFLFITSAIVWSRDLVRIPAPHWRDVRTLTLALTIPAILALTIYPAVATLTGITLLGPTSDSFFGSITSATSYLLPLALVTLVLVGHALRDRSAAFAFAAGLVLNLTVTLAYALWLTQSGATLGLAEQIRLVQLNVIASALFGLAWAATWRFSKAQADRAGAVAPLLLQFHLGIAAFAMLCLIAPATWRLYIAPHLDPASIAEVGNLYGWIAALLICAGAALTYWPITASATNALGGAAMLVAPLAAFSLTRGQTTAWAGYHALLIAFAIAGWAILGLGWLTQLRSNESFDALDDSPEAEASNTGKARRAGTIWASIFGCLTLAFAFRALDGDPAAPTWTLAGIAAASILAVGLAIQTLRSEWLYPAGLLNAAATIAWQHYTRTRGVFTPFLELVQVNALVLACTGIATLALELFVLRPMRSQVVRRGFAPFHHLAAVLSLLLVSALAFFLLVDARLNPILTWSALGATLMLLTACLWDEDANYPIKALYALGLATLASAMGSFYRFGDIFELSPIALAAYSLLWGFLFTQRTGLTRFAESTGIPVRRHWPSDRAGWLAAATLTLAILVSWFAFGQVIGNASLFMRLATGTSVIAMATALGLMAGNEKPTLTHYAALVFAAVGVIFWGWAWIPDRALLLEGLVVVMLVLAAMTAIYAVGLVKIFRMDDVWTRAGRNLVPVFGTLALAFLLVILGVEAANYGPTGTPIATPAAIAVLLAFVGLAAGCIVCAVVPGKDPFDLSERGRTVYVYAAEVLLILLFVHTKLVWPDLLQIGIWRRYWPVIIILISFLGVGLAETFRRQNRMVLAEPMERTGALLPIVPVLTFFMFGSHANYSHVLFLTAIVYGALAVMRKSFVFGVLSALAGNGGLWYLLSQTQNLGFASHPQLWLIPAALSVLAAAQLNKDRLSADQMRVIRYITVMIVYASSTADILINGLTEAPHLPLLLALLSVAGVMLGILLRVQSFLFLGTTFLLVSVAAMIQYATLQVGGSWPWLIAGILLGAAIVTLFALFEKKRNDMLALVDGLKEWQG